MVYFIGNKTAIKIGYSNDPASRLKGLQTSSSSKLKLIAVISGGRTKEKQLHFQFKKYRLTGEWFMRHQVINEYIQSVNKLDIYEKQRHMPTRRLSRLRALKRLTLNDMAQCLGMSKQGVLDIEKRFEEGRVSINKLKAYTDILELRIVIKDRRGKEVA